MIFVAIVSAAAGVIILRRRGVYFSLLTLALAALTYTVAFRWSTVTGGEDGLGGLQRGSIGPLSLDAALTYSVPNPIKATDTQEVSAASRLNGPMLPRCKPPKPSSPPVTVLQRSEERRVTNEGEPTSDRQN